MKPSGVYVCPKCGFKPLVGQDVETDGTRNIKKMSKHETVYTKSDKQSWWSQIKFYQRHRAAQGNLSAMAGVLIPFRRNSANGPTA